jgi:hypothetical protein
MIRNDVEAEAEPFSDFLAAYDDDQAAGRTPVAPSSVPPELSERLARVQACVRRLDQERRQAAGFAGIFLSGIAPDLVAPGCALKKLIGLARILGHG